MTEASFRFLHAGDFQLERPPCGFAEAPEHLRQGLLDCPYRAAERVFDHALAERVDFIVLAGGLLDAALTGPHGPVFLVRQFERLAAQNVPIYWTAVGTDAPERWPHGMRLPANVFRIVPGKQESHVFEQGGRPVAWLTVPPHPELERPRLRGVPLEREELFHIVLGRAPAPDWTTNAAAYWALGGAVQRGTSVAETTVVHFAGTPQGRSFEAPGLHGCTLVPVTTLAPPRLSFLATSTVVFHQESLTIDADTTSERLERLLRERTAALGVAHAECEQWIRWQIRGTGPLLRRLRTGTLTSDLISGLRRQFGHARPAIWTESISADASAVVPEDAIEQDSVLGEYLRALNFYRNDPATPIDLRPLVGDADAAVMPDDALLVAEGPLRDELLDAAAALGIDLLGEPEAVP